MSNLKRFVSIGLCTLVAHGHANPLLQPPGMPGFVVLAAQRYDPAVAFHGRTVSTRAATEGQSALLRLPHKHIQGLHRANANSVFGGANAHKKRRNRGWR
jgi:hypothetical protein